MNVKSYKGTLKLERKHRNGQWVKREVLIDIEITDDEGSESVRCRTPYGEASLYAEKDGCFEGDVMQGNSGQISMQPIRGQMKRMGNKIGGSFRIGDGLHEEKREDQEPGITARGTFQASPVS